MTCKSTTTAKTVLLYGFLAIDEKRRIDLTSLAVDIPIKLRFSQIVQ